MIASYTVRRRVAALIVCVSCCMVLANGCGEPDVQVSTMPPAEWVQKLVKEHPELFQRKVGKKVEQLEGRDRRAIIREQWEKAKAEGTL